MVCGSQTIFCVTWYFMATNVAMKYDVEQIYSSEVTTALQTKSSGMTDEVQRHNSEVTTA